MIVAKTFDDGYGVEKVEFDTGLTLSSEFEPDCCAVNFLDFEQLVEGREFLTMTPKEFVQAITALDDGYSVVDSMGVPAWIQARSAQNGYYSTNVRLVASLGKERAEAPRVDGRLED